VNVTCNEFGVYRKVVSAVDRAAWIRDVRTAMEKHGIGWAMWDYQGGFDVVNKVNGRAVPDPAMIAALGLKPPN
jgi:Tfp pilus assembly protein PilZ